MFETRSRGYATDLMLASLDGDVSRGDGYFAARTPSSPSFWWGNFVLFADPPRKDLIQKWESVFDDTVGRTAGIGHRNFAWDSIDGETGDADAFVARGYALTRDYYLFAEETRPSPHHRADLQIRPIEGDTEWARADEIAMESFSDEQRTPSFRSFLSQQAGRYRRLVEMGHGKWFGAFIDDMIVASMGIFVRDKVGRCQSVATSPEFRRSGCCGTLVHAACTFAFEKMGATEIAMMAAPTNPSLRVYQSVGFEIQERVASLSLSMAAPRASKIPSGGKIP
jgi:ribosomal protein S18 acetylase RimI-like enzyme